MCACMSWTTMPRIVSHKFDVENSKKIQAGETERVSMMNNQCAHREKETNRTRIQATQQLTEQATSIYQKCTIFRGCKRNLFLDTSFSFAV